MNNSTHPTRTLSDQEMQWTEDGLDRIEATNCSIQGLTSMLITLAEMMNDTSIDPHYRRELGSKAVMTVAYAVDHLTENITHHQEELQNILDGTAEAAHKARMDCLSARLAQRRRKVAPT
ncbi:hypothetical protein [Desulfobulbus elongatus]|uniref:hypothetical protein n=1 Tax=Desulfobulbus elongatus TaxID=53332 RepID=UPI0004833C4B|nr:hypothetical protein [Desulfobulbus elongatus]